MVVPRISPETPAHGLGGHAGVEGDICGTTHHARRSVVTYSIILGALGGTQIIVLQQLWPLYDVRP